MAEYLYGGQKEGQEWSPDMQQLTSSLRDPKAAAYRAKLSDHRNHGTLSTGYRAATALLMAHRLPSHLQKGNLAEMINSQAEKSIFVTLHNPTAYHLPGIQHTKSRETNKRISLLTILWTASLYFYKNYRNAK